MSDDLDVEELLESLDGDSTSATPATQAEPVADTETAAAEAGSDSGTEEGDSKNVYISKSFTLYEFLYSQTAERDKKMRKQQMNPPAKVIESLRYLTNTSLQPIRDRLAYPLTVSSGYRSPALNKAVNGSKTSQHCFGEAADIKLPDGFLAEESTAPLRQLINEGVFNVTGAYLRPDVNANFYLFAYICLYLNELDIDQVIHEYGDGYGKPSWVHVSASTGQDKRQILAIGRYVKKEFGKSTRIISLEEALRMGI